MAPSKATGVSLFKVVYDLDPLGPLDLILRQLDQKSTTNAEQRVAEIKKLHEQVWIRNEKSSISDQTQANRHRKKKVFQPGDLVWIHLRKDRFPAIWKTKLMPWADGPFEITERLNDNAYKVDILGFGLLVC